MELFNIIVAFWVPMIGILALHWDTSLFVWFFVLDSLVLGVLTWFKIKESDDSAFIYYQPAEHHRKVGNGSRFERCMFFAFYIVIFSLFFGAVLYNYGADSFGDAGVWMIVLLSGAFQAWEYIRLRNTPKPTVTMGYQMISPFKRMALMMCLAGLAVGDESSMVLNIAALVVSLFLDIWFYAYKQDAVSATKR